MFLSVCLFVCFCYCLLHFTFWGRGHPLRVPSTGGNVHRRDPMQGYCCFRVHLVKLWLRDLEQQTKARWWQSKGAVNNKGPTWDTGNMGPWGHPRRGPSTGGTQRKDTVVSCDISSNSGFETWSNRHRRVGGRAGELSITKAPHSHLT